MCRHYICCVALLHCRVVYTLAFVTTAADVMMAPLLSADKHAELLAYMHGPFSVAHADLLAQADLKPHLWRDLRTWADHRVAAGKHSCYLCNTTVTITIPVPHVCQPWNNQQGRTGQPWNNQQGRTGQPWNNQQGRTGQPCDRTGKEPNQP